MKIPNSLKEELLYILKRLIQIPTENPPGKTIEVVNFLANEVFLEEEGFQNEIVSYIENGIELHNLITKIIGLPLIKHSVVNQVKNPKPYDTDIILGMDPSFIAKKHGTTVSFIQKRKSELKNDEGIDIVDGRSKTARLGKYITMDDNK